MSGTPRFSTILAATGLLAVAAVLLMVVGMNRGAPSGERAYASDPGAEAEAEAVEAAAGADNEGHRPAGPAELLPQSDRPALR